MLNHFGITGKQFLRGQRTEKRCGNNHQFRLPEQPHLVFQRIEIDACFATYGGINRTQKRRRDIYERDAAFKRGCGKSPHIGNNTATEIYYNRFAGSTPVAELLPYHCQRVNILEHFPGLGHNHLRTTYRL